MGSHSSLKTVSVVISVRPGRSTYQLSSSSTSLALDCELLKCAPLVDFVPRASWYPLELGEGQLDVDGISLYKRGCQGKRERTFSQNEEWLEWQYLHHRSQEAISWRRTTASRTACKGSTHLLTNTDRLIWWKGVSAVASCIHGIPPCLDVIVHRTGRRMSYQLTEHLI